MRSNLWRMTLALLFAVAVLGLAPAPASAQGVSVFVDGNRLNFDQPPVMVGGRTLVPLRGIFEALGATVVWDAPTRTVRAQRDTTNIELMLGSTRATVNGQLVTLDVPAQSVGGRTMVPLRFIGEALGADVEWRAATRTVLITSTGGGEPPIDGPSTGPVTISKVVVSPQRPLNIGDTLTVIATGTPGGQASFDVVGVRTGIAMPEVSSGRYQGTLAIGQGLTANAAALIVRLARGGQEDVEQASTTVTIGTTSGGTTQITEFPAPNTTAAERRPNIGATFPNGVSPGNVRMWVDGNDVSNQLIVQGNQLIWRPGYDLSVGQHNVRISGSDNFGNAIDRSWTFTIGQSGQSSRFPTSGTTATSRPAIGMSFPQAVRTETARLWVDGQEFTNQAQITPWQISWTPPYDLSQGTHTVRVDATTQSGQFVNEVWSFNVGTGGNTGGTNTTGLINNVSLTPDPPYSLGQTATVTLTGSPGGQAWFDVGGRTGIQMPEIQSGVYRGSYTVGQGDQSSYMQLYLRMPDGRQQQVQSSSVIQINSGGSTSQLQVFSPGNNANVDPNFNVVGRATPGATVQVQAQSRQALIPGVISIPGRTITNSVRADANGNFNVPIGAADMPSGTILYMTVVAQDQFGNQSAPNTFQVRRN